VPNYLFYMPQLTLAKTLLAQGTEESLQEAADLLDELHDFLSSIHNNIFLIEVLALRAILHDTMGEQRKSIDTLREAIALAEPSGFIRCFVDMGPRMAHLLRRLIQRNFALVYVGKILAAFKIEQTGVVQEATDSQTKYLSSLNEQVFLEIPLTHREIEVIELLMVRQSNKEIGETLSIATETVKSHLTSIYRKLNISGRKQAVDKITALAGISRH
jgi:LuxR family maltose regulon positive regulatory protein